MRVADHSSDPNSAVYAPGNYAAVWTQAEVLAAIVAMNAMHAVTTWWDERHYPMYIYRWEAIRIGP